MDKDGSCKCPLAQAALFCFSQGVRFTVIRYFGMLCARILSPLKQIQDMYS